MQPHTEKKKLDSTNLLIAGLIVFGLLAAIVPHMYLEKAYHHQEEILEITTGNFDPADLAALRYTPYVLGFTFFTLAMFFGFLVLVNDKETKKKSETGSKQYTLDDMLLTFKKECFFCGRTLLEEKLVPYCSAQCRNLDTEVTQQATKN